MDKLLTEDNLIWAHGSTDNIILKLITHQDFEEDKLYIDILRKYADIVKASLRESLYNLRLNKEA